MHDLTLQLFFFICFFKCLPFVVASLEASRLCPKYGWPDLQASAHGFEEFPFKRFKLFSGNAFGMFHTKAVVSQRGEKLIVNDLNLLYFYHNRLVGWELEEIFRGEN